MDEEKKVEKEGKGGKGEWNSKLEEAARDIGEAAQGYKHMHISEAQKASKKHHRLMGTGIVMGPLASVFSSVGVALSLENNPIISVFVIVLGFLSGIIVATVKFGKYDEVSNANKSAAARYTSIEANVRRQLGLYRKDRVAAISYMEWLETKYEELLMSAPLLPASAYQAYSSFAKKKGLTVPDKYDHIININRDYGESKVKDITNKSQISITVPETVTLSSEDVIVPHLCTETNTVKRGSTMSQIPQLNQCSDKMLEYEMNRLMGLR